MYVLAEKKFFIHFKKSYLFIDVEQNTKPVTVDLLNFLSNFEVKTIFVIEYKMKEKMQKIEIFMVLKILVIILNLVKKIKYDL